MWVVLYVVCIVLVNWTFTVLAPWSTPLGDLYIANVIVGFVFVLRDYAQREVGHKILLATLVAGVITYFMVDPAIAVASITAFVMVSPETAHRKRAGCRTLKLADDTCILASSISLSLLMEIINGS
jgi:hypothetical protein